MTSLTEVGVAVQDGRPPGGRPRRGRSHLRGPEGIMGWLFVSPVVVILGIFLFIPIVMALWVSLTNWNGSVNPFGGGPGAQFVGLKNYANLITTAGLTRDNFMQSIGNTFWYVIIVVPCQTVLALALALLVNSALKVVGITGPNWFADSRGLLHLLLGVFHVDNPGWAQVQIFGRSLWDWLSGPSVAFSVIIILVVWTTSGTFMLMFIAALQDIPGDVEEAAALDGASSWQRLRFVTLPMIRPTLFLVLTLGLIGTWQVFDQVFVLGKGAPAGTTLTPAYLSYQQSFGNFAYGSGAAMAFVVFAIIVVLTAIQRRVLTPKDERRPLLRRRPRGVSA